MEKTIILVEGIADLVFLKDFIEKHFQYFHINDVKINENTKEILLIHENENIVKIFVLGSKEALNDENKIKLVTSEINKEQYNLKLIILDADDDFEISKTLIENYLGALKLNNYYLFPNNKDVGDLETILENIQADEKIASCWSEFETCIKVKGTDYTIPLKKSKIHTYLEILNPKTNKGKDNCKERNRNYNDTKIWKLNDIENNYISELKTFLDLK